jgi:large subunit ribosomal protein L13
MVTKLKLYNPSASDLVSDWHVIDARGKVLGRLATEVAMLLMGKHRPEYVPHMLSGDFVVVTNAAEITTTGNKADQIIFKRHSQKPGKLKEIPFRRVQEKFPERIVEHAVRGMLPRNKLGDRMFTRLKVYAGEEHPHAAQLTWTERRPDRETELAQKAEEEAKKRAEARRRAEARKEIAASAAAKATAKDEAEAAAKPAAAEKKPATRRTTAAKTTGTRAKAAATKAATAKSSATPAKKAPARRTTTTRKSGDK